MFMGERQADTRSIARLLGGKGANLAEMLVGAVGVAGLVVGTGRLCIGGSTR